MKQNRTQGRKVNRKDAEYWQRLREQFAGGYRYCAGAYTYSDPRNKVILPSRDNHELR